jgi:Rrf2 family protein
MKIAAAGALQAKVARPPLKGPCLRRIVLMMKRLHRIQALVGELLQLLGGDPVHTWMSDRSNAARLVNQLDGFRRGRPRPLTVADVTTGEIAIERRLHRVDVAALDQHSRQMRTSKRLPARLGDHFVERHMHVELGERRDHVLDALPPIKGALVTPGHETPPERAKPEAEDVALTPAEEDRHLDAGHQLAPPLVRSPGCRQHPSDGVVIRHAKVRDARALRPSKQLLWRQHAVGVGRVAVQIDPNHDEILHEVRSVLRLDALFQRALWSNSFANEQRCYGLPDRPFVSTWPMQHLLQVSRKVDYALRAMIYLASLPAGAREPLQDVAQKNDIPKEFLSKIFKSLSEGGLVTAIRGPGGGVAMARTASEISFLDVIEAVEGPVVLNVCLDDTKGCALSSSCTMQSIWRAGQERMLDVYRATSLADLVGHPAAPVPLTHGAVRLDVGGAPRPLLASGSASTT